jgi:hypothetical protein
MSLSQDELKAFALWVRGGGWDLLEFFSLHPEFKGKKQLLLAWRQSENGKRWETKREENERQAEIAKQKATNITLERKRRKRTKDRRQSTQTIPILAATAVVSVLVVASGAVYLATRTKTAPLPAAHDKSEPLADSQPKLALRSGQNDQLPPSTPPAEPKTTTSKKDSTPPPANKPDPAKTESKNKNSKEITPDGIRLLNDVFEDALRAIDECEAAIKEGAALAPRLADTAENQNLLRQIGTKTEWIEIYDSAVRHSAVNPAQREKIFADITKSRKDVAKWKDMLKANKITAANQQQIVLEAKNATYNCQFQLKQLKEIKSMLNKPKK